MISQIIDVTDQYNATQAVKIDVSLWQNITVHIVGGFEDTGMNFYGSNDSGVVNGVSDGGPSMSLNYQPIRVTNLSDGTQSSTMPGAGLYSSQVFTKYVSLNGAAFADPTTSKVIVFLNKPY